MKLWYKFKYIDLWIFENFWCIFRNFNVKISFYWVIENVGIIGIVEIIEQFWSLWHSLASWLYEKKNYEKCMKWKKNKIVMKSESRVRRIKKGERSLGWKTQKFTLGRLQMGSIFGCRRVSFGENSRTIVHCMTVCHTFICIHLMIGCCGIEYNVIC